MQTEPKQMDILTLAFLGDAVYELAVRKRIIASGAVLRADALHRNAVSYVNASSQASFSSSCTIPSPQYTSQVQSALQWL